MQRKNKGKGCCKLNKVALFLVSLIMLIALALNSYATSCAFITPASNGYLTTGSKINITDADRGTLVRLLIVHINASSASTSNSTSFEITSFTNETKATNMPIAGINGTLNNTDALVLEPANDYVLTAWIQNITSPGSIVCNATVTGITIDRGDAPTVPTSISPSGILTSRDQTLSATVNGVNTTGCTLRFMDKNPGSSRYETTHSGDTCSLAFTNLPKGTYRYTFDASDGTNISAQSAITQFDIDIRTSTAKKAYIASGGKLPSSSTQVKAPPLNALDKAIAKAPPEAQKGLTTAKEQLQEEFTAPEIKKTSIGILVGTSIGAIGLVVPPLAVITIPAGAMVGGLIGAWF